MGKIIIDKTMEEISEVAGKILTGWQKEKTR